MLTTAHTSAVELHLPGLILTASRPNMQKILIIGFFFESRLYLHVNLGSYYLQYTSIPASKPSDQALFEVLEAVTLYRT
jgi:hypothetical protein